MARLLLCFKPATTDEESDTSTSQNSRTPGRRTEVVPTQSSDSGTSVEPRRIVTFVELLKRRSEPLGLVLKGGADCNQPVYVGQLYPGGAAEKSETLQVGDIIRGINGTATDHLNQSEANALLNNSGNVINLEVEYEAPPGTDADDGNEKKTALIKLQRGRTSGFGFTISGGRTENRHITVSNVMVGSMPYKNGILKAGDSILKINWSDVSLATQMEALSHLRTSEDVCMLEIEYDVTVHSGLSEYRGQLSVELLKPKGVSLGISLQESPPPEGGPLIISRVKEAGIADRCGALHVGDRLLSVNKENVVNMPVKDALHMLKHCDLVVELEIIQAHNFPDTDLVSHASRLPSLSSRLDNRSVMSSSSITTSHVATSHPETMIVTLVADDIGYGMSLQGGTTERGVYPILIASIMEGGPAAKLGQLQVGDQILGIDGIKMEGYSLQEAMKLVQEADRVIEMEVMFEVEDGSPPSTGMFEVRMKKNTASLNLGITLNGSRSPGDTIWISSLKEGGIAYRSGMLHSGDILLAMNGQSLENCNPREAARIIGAAGETVTLRVGREPSPPAANVSETIIYSVELHRNQQSLGITLTGSRDHVGHPIVISKIKEDGVAYKTGTLKVGDRILAINGEGLYDRTMPEAVRMLGAAGDVVNLKISKASRKHKSRHKSGSPTGRHRTHWRDYGGGGGATRDSFGSSSGSSFVGGPGYGRIGRIPRSLNYRLKHSFEPILGESASGCNTPDNLSLVSSIPPLQSPYAGHLAGGRGRGMGSHTPMSEASAASAFVHPGMPGANGGYQPHLWRGVQSPMDDDQMSSVSTRNIRRPYPHHLVSQPGADSSGPPLMLQYMLKQHSSSGALGGGASKQRDSSTDDEMSSHEQEGRVLPKYRRSSLPSDYSQQYSPQYVTRESHGDGPAGVVWDFKSRGRLQKPSIPVGRVSPITPSETEKVASVEEGNVAEKEVQYKPIPPHISRTSLPPNAKGPLPVISVAPMSRGSEGVNSVTPTTQSLGGESQDVVSLTSTVGSGNQGGVDSIISAVEAYGKERRDVHFVVPDVQGVGTDGEMVDSLVMSALHSLETECSVIANDVQGQRSNLPSDEGAAEDSEVAVMQQQPPYSPPTVEECEESMEASESHHPAVPPVAILTATETEDMNSSGHRGRGYITASDKTLGRTETNNTKLDYEVTPDTKIEHQHAKLKARLKYDQVLQVSPHVEQERDETPTSDTRLETPRQTEPSDDIRHLTHIQIEAAGQGPGNNVELDAKLKQEQHSPNGTLRHNNGETKTHLRPEMGVVSAESADPASPCPPLPLRHEGQAGHSNRSDHTPQSPLPPSATVTAIAAATTTTIYHRQSDSSNITKRTHHPVDLHLPTFPVSSPPPPYPPTKSHSNSSSPQSSLRRRNRNSNSGSSSNTGAKYKQATRNDRSLSQKPAAMSQPPNRLTAGPTMSSQQATNNRLHGSTTTGSVRPVQQQQPLAQLNEYKKTIHKADEFGRAMAALAESGSSDQDSDSEPHSKLSGLPLQDLAKVKEKMMTASPSTVVHRVVICKNPKEVSFGFSISDGQYDQGVYVKTVKPYGPSDRGGLQHYDKIIRVNDVVLLPEHRCKDVHPMLKKYGNDLVLMVRRQSSQVQKLNDLASS